MNAPMTSRRIAAVIRPLNMWKPLKHVYTRPRLSFESFFPTSIWTIPGSMSMLPNKC